MAASRTIVIAGAGIGGLTAALAVAAGGFDVIVVEKAARLEEAGAGLQLSPNASRVLIGLGLHERLAGTAITPDAISIFSADRGELVRLPLGEAASRRAGAPYWVMHRADLQAALLAQVTEHPGIALRLGCRFESFDDRADGVSVGLRDADGLSQTPALALIGADGVWSAVRGQLFPDARPRATGLIAWRGTVDADRLPRDATPPRVQLWMGPDAHLVAYPVSGGRQINMVAITSGDLSDPGWSAPGEAADIRSRFPRQWPDAARSMIGAVAGWTRWSLVTMPDGGVWTRGAVALLGDASHAMLPFAAQGAGMAIEDAAVLAKCLGRAGDSSLDIPAALARYASLRRARVGRVQRTARRSGRIYHLRGPLALARDLAITAIGARRLHARQDWIYDWQA